MTFEPNRSSDTLDICSEEVPAESLVPSSRQHLASGLSG